VIGLLLAMLGAAHASEVVVGTDAPSVQAAVDLASPGDTVVLPVGAWPGPVVVNKPLHLTSRGGTLDTAGEGHTLVLESPGIVVDKLHIRGSGDEMNTEDACIRTRPGATGAIIRDSRLENCLFGIWIHTTVGVKVLRTYVGGRPTVRDSDKGNGIHLFDASQLEIRGNEVVGTRDGIYVSATEFSVIADNDVSHQRYGIHYMYSYDNTISGNTAHDNNGGMALMGSFRLKVHHNRANGNRKQGLLFRDIQYCDIHHNEAAGNAEGMFFFSSLDNDIHHNVLRGNGAGARVWAGSERNRVWGNSFVGNREALFYVAASDQQWGLPEEGGNYWSDHIAWDQDGDGIADRPYRADTTVATVLHRWPQAVLLLNSPAMELIQASQARIPVLRTPTVVDPWPLARPPENP
jgi:nitrous oxidase accessory protein